MTFDDLDNEIKLYDIFVTQGKKRIEVERGPLSDDVREVVRLGLKRGWLISRPARPAYDSGVVINGYYELTYSGKAWFEKRKDDLRRSSTGSEAA